MSMRGKHAINLLFVTQMFDIYDEIRCVAVFSRTFSKFKGTTKA